MKKQREKIRCFVFFIQETEHGPVLYRLWTFRLNDLKTHLGGSTPKILVLQNDLSASAKTTVTIGIKHSWALTRKKR
ncbi:pectin lyase [Bacillus subtilis]|uniref:Pectin lyase n=1 Tax=Bacillus subtilis TaxID=1423 RepID=A0A0D1KYD5_BACIU|nr:pectin lyase [Bacillus subtilis]